MIDKQGNPCYTEVAEMHDSRGRFAFLSPSFTTEVVGKALLTRRTHVLAVHLSNDGQSSEGRFAMVKSNCKWCGKEIIRARQAVFCSNACKGAWQREQKPVDKAWLYQKYIVEGLSTYQIAKIVERNPKQVWNWLKGYNIETRNKPGIRSRQSEWKPYQNREWLYNEYVFKGRSAAEIAEGLACGETNVLYFMQQFGIPTRLMSKVRELKHWGAAGKKNPMFGKRGPEVPSWKGGCTAERQAFYSSLAWKKLATKVRRRDKNTCQRCGTVRQSRALDIHHIASFAVESQRLNPDNLILLCRSCHRWVHSKENVDKEYLKEVLPSGAK